MNSNPQRAAERAPRFYSPDYRRQLRDAGAFRDLSPSEHVVLAALCDRANASGIAWPAIETMADQYGLGESTVRQAIRRLTTRGLVFVVRQAGRVNTYRMTIPQQCERDSATPVESQTYPSEIWPPPLQNLAPIMTNDHTNQHDQQHHASAPTHEAAASLASLLNEESHFVAPVSSDAGDSPPRDELIMLLTPDLVDRLRGLGLAPAKVNRYGAERVRWVLDRLDADRARKVIGNPAGWMLQVLKDTWNDPLPVLQLGLPFAAAAAAATRPPEGTRWGRDTVTGRVIEVERVDDDSVKFADGSRLPARMWADGWEWLASHPDGGSTRPAAQVEPELAPDNVGEPNKRTTLALITTWMAIGTRTAVQLATKLEARGLTLDDWEAYQASQALAARLDGEYILSQK